MKFWKMHGAGNDFIITDNREKVLTDENKIAKEVCERHFGIGADGFMVVENSNVADVKMKIYNADGTLATMCGNGIRCFSKYVRDTNIVKKTEFDVETDDGIKKVTIINENQRESLVKINMGGWKFQCGEILIDACSPEFINEEIPVNKGTKMVMSCIHLGVSHGVVFIQDETVDYVGAYGEILEHYPKFKNGMNINFVKVKDESHITLSTWERGVGRTLACGTGTCASVVIGNRLGLIGKKINATVPGGSLKIEILENNTVDMEGPAATICKGEI